MKFKLGGFLKPKRQFLPVSLKPIKQVSGGNLNATNRATTQYKTLKELRAANPVKPQAKTFGEYINKPKVKPLRTTNKTFGQFLNSPIKIRKPTKRFGSIRFR